MRDRLTSGGRDCTLNMYLGRLRLRWALQAKNLFLRKVADPLPLLRHILEHRTHAPRCLIVAVMVQKVQLRRVANVELLLLPSLKPDV